MVNGDLYIALESAGAKKEHAARAAHTLAKLELAMMHFKFFRKEASGQDGQASPRFVPVSQEIFILRLLVFVNLGLTVMLMFKVLS